MIRKAVVLGVVGVLFAGPALAHGGGLNAQGCHKNRKTGDYHCHGSGNAEPSRQSMQLMAKPASGRTSYANCAAARRAGAAPLRVGEPGYARKLDRDGDGIACE